MKSRIPDSFEPIDQELSLDESIREYPALIRLYVYTEEGHKNYTEATAEETETWLTEIAAGLQSEGTTNLLKLASIRKATLNLVLLELCAQSRELLGGPEYWNSLKEWKRLQEQEEKDKKGKKE